MFGEAAGPVRSLGQAGPLTHIRADPVERAAYLGGVGVRKRE